MNNSKRCCTVVLALLLGMLSGCAAYNKCGVGGCPGDAEITAAVQAEFAKHAELQPPNTINVQTINHVVYLYGLVATDLQRQTAESIAMQVPNVAKVVNSIGTSGNGR
jgi:osmotically-inducible protein OsmY